MRIFRITVGAALVLFSLVACGVSLIAIVDPAGTKMADDNDPSGPPPNRLYSAYALGVSVAIGAAGVYLVRKSSHSRRKK